MDFRFVPWMTYTDSDSRIVWSKDTMEISQPVVAAMTTALFEADLPWFNIEFVMYDKNFFGFNFIKLSQRECTLTRAIHKCHGFQ